MGCNRQIENCVFLGIDRRKASGPGRLDRQLGVDRLHGTQGRPDPEQGRWTQAAQYTVHNTQYTIHRTKQNKSEDNTEEPYMCCMT